MNVAFINENTLGHGSYLMPFVRWFEQHPEAGIQPHVLNATPLPERLQFQANFSVPGLRGSGLDFHNARWRLTVSQHVLEQLDELRRQQPIDAVVVNTQSVALRLIERAHELPVFVCLDSTFAQLARSRWFAPNAPTRLFLPLTLRALRKPERAIIQCAHTVCPWSEPVRESLVQDYQIPAEKTALLPPSLDVDAIQPREHPKNERPQILFVGGDFDRKGGPLLLLCFRKYFAERCDLHLVTKADLTAGRRVSVHRDLEAHTPEWTDLWRKADVFVFPSTLETFGIVLLEALAFGVPTVSTEVGAAREILDGGKAGWLLPMPNEELLRQAITEALDHPEKAQAKAAKGRERIVAHYNLAANARALATRLHQAAVD
ncbi:MAG: glycosyltransferase family 4 protein [Verrucomicrobiota bacterium]